MKLADYLTIWAEWMAASASDGPEAFPTISAGFDEVRTNYSVSIEDSANIADMREASYGPIIDACIESLEPHQRIAIHHVFGFSRSVRLSDLNAGEVCRDAMPRLAVFVRRRLPLEDEAVAYAQRWMTA